MNTVDQEKEYFQVIYDGPALVSHEMDVRDLAPALLAISDVLDEANRINYGDQTKVQVSVKGTFKSGSFGFDLSVVQGGINGLTSLFNSDQVHAAINLLELLGFTGGGGLLGFLLWLKNRKIKNIENSNDTKSTVEVVDGDKFETSPNVIALFSNVKIRTSIQKVITEPLSREGIDSFQIKKENEEVAVKKDEKDYFKLSEIPDELLRDQEREVILTVVTIALTEGHKWKFSDGNVEFYATISDKSFIDKVQQNKEGFFKDDIYKVKLHEKQWISDTGLKSDYEITEVLEHRSGAKQIKLPFTEHEEET